MQLQGILCSVSIRWRVLGNATEHLSTFGVSISFPGIFSPKENCISKQYTNDLVIVFPLGFPSLLVSTSDWLHISLFLDPFVCSVVFSFFRALLAFVQLLVCSRCPLFTCISSVHFTCCYFAWITASFGHSSSHCSFYSPCFSVFSLGVLFPSPSFLSSWFVLTGRKHLVSQQLCWRLGQSTKWSFLWCYIFIIFGRTREWWIRFLLHNRYILQPTPYPGV